MSQIALNKQTALNWIEAFNRQDLERLLNLYAEDAIHFSPKLKSREPQTNGWIRGKPALRSWWKDAFDRMPSLQYQLQNLIINDEQILMEYLRTVPGEAEMMVAEILELGDGLIVRSRVYHG
ncbi:MAG: nuclear transport factor 2 family protein [Ferruginibacter sp.]